VVRPDLPVSGETGSLLPLPDAAYLEVGATTAPDLQRLAPRTTSADRAVMAAADPSLAGDLESWFDPACAAPRVSLLGPVQVHTTGEPLHRRQDYYAELVAFLVLGRAGRSANDIAEAFALDHVRVRNDLLVIRAWLGEDPWHGRTYLTWSRPRGAQQVADAVGAYRVAGALTDLDLFLRLRLRAQSRGSDGIEDLVTALSLVRGTPFTDLPAGAWSWLAREDRVDEYLAAAVVDVAHLVTTHALSAGDVDLAQRANDSARLAAPDEDTARWDQVAVEAARGHRDRVEHLVGGLCAEAGETASTRTREIRLRREWSPENADK